MIIDIITALFLILGIIYGYSKGIIHSVLTLIAIVFGIALAMRCSYIVTAYLHEALNISPSILPVISFIMVVIATLLIFRLVAYILQRILKALSLNFINRFAGAFLWLFIALLFISTALWFADHNDLLTQNVRLNSYSYRYLMPLAPIMLDYLGQILPFFQSLFEQFDTLFEKKDPTTV